MVNQRKFDQRKLDSDLDGQVDDAEKLQGNQPSDLGNSLDKLSILEDSQGDIRTSGMIKASELSDIVTVVSESSNTLLDLSLASNEIAIIYDVRGYGYTVQFGYVQNTADGNSIPVLQGLADNGAGTSIEFDTHPTPLIVEDSVDITMRHSGDDNLGFLVYQVITV